MELNEFELAVWRRLREAGFERGDLMLQDEEEFINACLGRVLPGEIIFDYPLETIIAFWFNRVTNKLDTLRLIVDDIMGYFKDRYTEFRFSLPEPEEELGVGRLGEQLKLF